MIDLVLDTLGAAIAGIVSIEMVEEKNKRWQVENATKNNAGRQVSSFLCRIRR